MSTDEDKPNLCRLAAKSLHGVLRQTWKMPISVRTNPNINFLIKAFHVAVSLAPLDNRSLNWKSLCKRTRFYMDFSRFWYVRFLLDNIDEMSSAPVEPGFGGKLFIFAREPIATSTGQRSHFKRIWGKIWPKPPSLVALFKIYLE